MKFKVGDKVLVTAGKDKGKKSEIVRVLPSKNLVVVKDANVYAKHIKKIADRAGEKIRRERPMSLAKIAILNDKGQADRIAYRVSKDGRKERIFKKTGKVVPEQKKKGKK